MTAFIYHVKAEYKCFVFLLEQDVEFQGGTSVVVRYCYLFLLSVFIVWFTYYVSDIF